MISVALIRGSGSDDSEYNHLKNQIESEQFHPSSEGGLPRFFRDLPKDEQQAKLKDRLKKYCQKVFFSTRLLFAILSLPSWVWVDTSV